MYRLLSSISLSLKDQVFIGGIVLGLILAIIALIVALVAGGRARRLRSQYRSMMKGETGKDLESLINQYSNKIIVLEHELERVTKLLENHEERLVRKLETTKVARYNAFGEKGNDLSFSVSFLDERGTGTVMSSIFGRDESRVYAKPINARQSTYTLTNEEQEVISTSNT